LRLEIVSRNKIVDTQTIETAATSDARISAHARLLSEQLQALGSRLFPPDSQKLLRSFSSGEAAKLLRVSDG